MPRANRGHRGASLDWAYRPTTGWTKERYGYGRGGDHDMTRATLNLLAQRETTRREILHKSDLIPPLPDLVMRVLGMLNEPTTEPEDLQGLVQNDQVLVAKMLATVNSAFYGLNRPIRSIKEAVMVLGFRGVRSLVLATSTARLMQRDFRAYGHEPFGLWAHAVVVAAGGRRLATACRFSPDDAEAAFIAGLLHDIGKLLLVGYLGDMPTMRGTLAELCEQERRHIGLDHAEAGGLVVARWNLAPEIQEVFQLSLAEGAQPSRLAAAVRVAEAFAHERSIGFLPGMQPAVEYRPDDFAVLGLDDARWSVLRDDLVKAMDGALAAFSKLGS
ncbi:MAG: HDOD domain-containing protein [Planctomycetota bacterium]|jgi:HD-like signal output (HDOD) protein